MSKKAISVLLVEDNFLVKRMGTLILEELGCKVDAVDTGGLALEYANRMGYNLIFMDIGLPDIDGLSVISQIRSTEGLNKMAPIIALTAHSDKKYVQQSFEAGATEFLVKPLTEEMGREVLERYIEGQAD